MKKFTAFLVACVFMTQTVFAATTALVESLLEIEAITNAIGNPTFTVIPPVEFIISIKRVKRQINVLGDIKYIVLTRAVSPTRCQRAAPPVRYIATVNVAQNPGIGPNIVTLISIVPANN